MLPDLAHVCVQYARQHYAQHMHVCISHTGMLDTHERMSSRLQHASNYLRECGLYALSPFILSTGAWAGFVQGNR